MREELKKFNVKLESFNIEEVKKMSFSKFEKLHRHIPLISANCKEIYAILVPSKKD